MDAGFNLLGQFDEDLSGSGGPSMEGVGPSFGLGALENQSGGYEDAGSELVHTKSQPTPQPAQPAITQPTAYFEDFKDETPKAQLENFKQL